jgi:CubicO group peptidase (beta-lactamase class C family)
LPLPSRGRSLERDRDIAIFGFATIDQTPAWEAAMFGRTTAMLATVVMAMTLPAAAANLKAIPMLPFNGANTIAGQMIRDQKIEAAFDGWVRQHHIVNAALAIRDHGSIVDGHAYGRDAPAEPEPVASESKSVTAMCVLKLVEARQLKFSDTLGSLLPDFFHANPPHDAAAKNITLGALLTQSSGIDNDPTQGPPLQQFRPFNQTEFAKELSAGLSKPLGRPKYFYNNINYAALGLVIETVTGKSYEDFCNRSVLVPAGITDAMLNPPWRMMGSFGGWKLSAHDEAKLLAYFEPGSGLVRTAASAWPTAAAGGGALYSLGVEMRPAGSGFNFWHFGSWTADQPKASFGSYFLSLPNGMGVAVTYQPTIDDATGSALDAAMESAMNNP